MQTQQPQQEKPTPILEVAWTRYSQLDLASKKRTKAYISLRRWIAIFGVLATLFAILTEIYPDNFSEIGRWILKFLLILSPILASGFAYFANSTFSSGDWLITRAGAEEIKKEIYTFRTILQDVNTRRTWLEKRLGEIQRSVYRGMNGELVMEPYKGPIPPSYSAKDPSSDPGFQSLTGEEYFRYRLEHQLNWHTRKINDRQRDRIRLKVLIGFTGGAGALLAALGGPFSLWVALTAALTTVFMGWQELRNLDRIVHNYNKVILELNILSDHWKNLTTEEQTQTEFFKMVRSTESILWSQNVEYIKAMQEALKESDLDEAAGLITRVINEQRESDRRYKKSIEDAVVDYTNTTLREGEETLTENYEAALGSLAEEASSDLVQAELASMQKSIASHFSGLMATLEAIADEFSGVDIGRDTPPAVLNDYLARFPKSQEVKG